MICPNCHNDNREGAKFCDNCGHRLEVKCAHCGTVNRSGVKFCDNCGHDLNFAAAAPAAAPSQSPLQRFIPQELATKLEAARGSGAMQGERRIVTMLFCDVKGSTAAAERLDPEEWTEIINGAFEHMITPVYRYEGTVARLMGDGILAFFGAPIAHEDDPQRAVMAALDIVAAIGHYRERVQHDWHIDLGVRVGINTGLVVVGTVGSDLRMEYTAMGDAINLASRMEQTAEPGTVRVAEDTYKLVAPLFEFEPLGEIDVKGKQEPVLAYRALRRKAAPGRVRGIEGLEAALVGRGKELAVLRDLVARVRGGEGQIVSIMGEAGLGKSRLIAELKELEAGPGVVVPVQWSEMAGTSYSSNRPYDTFQNQIRLSAGITPSDVPAVAREKLGAFVGADPQQEMLQGIYERLLGLESDATFDIEGETFKRALFKAMLETMRAVVGGTPTVFVFDDMHWTDPASLELEVHLLQLARELPVLFIFAFRLDWGAPVWAVRSRLKEVYPKRYSEIELQPLDTADGTQLVESLLDIPDMPSELRDTIRDKADGNPFFVEEIVRTLLQSGLVIRDAQGARWANGSSVAAIEIPENVQALLASRVDRLADDVRRTLQLAAVIGRSFYRRVLQAISEASERLSEHLQILEAAEFIHEATRVPEWEYIFRHALTQEAVYKTLLRRHRREFHRRAGEALELFFPERLEELAPLLAHHFDEAGQWERAFHYHTTAGHAAYSLNAYQDAEKHYGRAVEIRRSGHVPGDQLIELYRRRGRTLELLLDYDRAVANYEEMERLGQEEGHEALVLAGWIALATILATFTPVHDAAQAISLSQRALELARHLGEREAESKALWNLSLAYGFGDDVRKAIVYGEASLAIARELNLVRQIPITMNDLFRSYFIAGEIDKALGLIEETQRRLREVGNLPILASNLISSGVLFVQLGEYQRALASLQDATSLSRSIGNLGGEVGGGFAESLVYMERGEFDKALRFAVHIIQLAEKVGQTGEMAFNYLNLSWAYSHLGNIPEAFSYAQRAVTLSTGIILVHPHALAALARAHLLQGDRTAARQALQEAVAETDSDSWFVYHPFAFLVQGELLLVEGKIQQAVERCEALLQKMRQHRARTWRPDALLLRAKALRAAGREDEAFITLREAQAEAEALGGRRSLWQILVMLAEVENRRGEMTAAAAHRQEARQIIEYIIAHMPEPDSQTDLRRSFLALPEVQAILNP